MGDSIHEKLTAQNLTRPLMESPNDTFHHYSVRMQEGPSTKSFDMYTTDRLDLDLEDHVWSVDIDDHRTCTMELQRYHPLRSIESRDTAVYLCIMVETGRSRGGSFFGTSARRNEQDQ